MVNTRKYTEVCYSQQQKKKKKQVVYSRLGSTGKHSLERYNIVITYYFESLDSRLAGRFIVPAKNRYIKDICESCPINLADNSMVIPRTGDEQVDFTCARDVAKALESLINEFLGRSAEK